MLKKALSKLRSIPSEQTPDITGSQTDNSRQSSDFATGRVTHGKPPSNRLVKMRKKASMYTEASNIAIDHPGTGSHTRQPELNTETRPSHQDKRDEDDHNTYKKTIEEIKDVLHHIDKLQHIGDQDTKTTQGKKIATILIEVLDRNCKQIKVEEENDVTYAQKYAKYTKHVLQHIGNNDDPWKNIRKNSADFVKNVVLRKVIDISWNQEEAENSRIHTEKCINDVKHSLRHMGDNDDPWKNIEWNIKNSIIETILTKVIDRSWDKYKGEDIINRATKVSDDIKHALRHISNNDDPWKNIEWPIKMSVTDSTLTKVIDRSWEEGKGKTFDERSNMCWSAIQAAATQMDFGDRVESLTQGVLRNKTMGMIAGINDWQYKGLPGRGWQREGTYENKQARLNAKDKEICNSINQTNTHLKEIQEIYLDYGARESLNINASELKKLTWERMFDDLHNLAKAEEELRERVGQMSLFRYSTERTKRIEGTDGLPVENLGAILDILSENWLSPAKGKYEAARQAAEKSYEKSILLEQTLPNSLYNIIDNH